jgi:hypothetical protein
MYVWMDVCLYVCMYVGRDHWLCYGHYHEVSALIYLPTYLPLYPLSHTPTYLCMYVCMYVGGWMLFKGSGVSRERQIPLGIYLLGK